jgi:hypothetical protein
MVRISLSPHPAFGHPLPQEAQEERAVIIKEQPSPSGRLWERGDRAAVGEGMRQLQYVTVILKHQDLAMTGRQKVDNRIAASFSLQSQLPISSFEFPK